MKKVIQQLNTKRNNFNEKLKHHLDGLPSDAKLNIILLMMAFYLIATILVLAGIIRERSNDALNIRHIDPAPIIDAPAIHKQPAGDDTIFHYPE